MDDAALDERIDEELARGFGAKHASELVAAWSGRPKREVYERIVRRKPRDRHTRRVARATIRP